MLQPIERQAFRAGLAKRAELLAQEGIGKDGRFWTLAQSLSALYPSGIDEKRWIDGELARRWAWGYNQREEVSR